MEDFNIKDAEILKAILHNTIQTNVLLMAQTELLLKVHSISQEDYHKNRDFYLAAAETASVQIREQLFVLFGDLDPKTFSNDK